MRKFLLATSAAALALAFTGRPVAEPRQIPVAATTVAPPETTTADGLVFSKDAGQAKPIDKPGRSSRPRRKPQPPIGQARRTGQARRCRRQTSRPKTPRSRISCKELAETKLQQYVPREQDRAGVLAFYKARNFAPLWIASGKPAPRAEQAAGFLTSVAADGLDPADYPTPSFGDADPAKLAADELAMTNSVVTFARHASIGRVAFTRVSGAVYFDQKAPDAADVLGKLADSTDVRATLDAFNPQAPAIQGAQGPARRGPQRQDRPRSTTIAARRRPPPEAESKAKSKTSRRRRKRKTKVAEAKPKTASADTIIANMERWRWMPHDLGATYVMVNIPDYTLKVVQNGKTVWQTKIVVGKPGDQATPLLTETMKFITVNPTWNVPPSIIRNEYLPALARDPERAGADRPADRPQCGRLDPHLPAAGRAQCARPHPLQFPEPLPGLSARHAGQESVRRRPRAPTATAACGCRTRTSTPRCCWASRSRRSATPPQRIQAMYGTSERTINFKTPDPGLHHLPDRVRRRRRQAAGARRRLRPRPRHPERPARRPPQLRRADRAQLQLQQQAGEVGGDAQPARQAIRAPGIPAIARQPGYTTWDWLRIGGSNCGSASQPADRIQDLVALARSSEMQRPPSLGRRPFRLRA